jgi:uncharacterized protein
MSLKSRIQEDMKSAMRAAAKERLGTIRMLMAAIKQREVDERIELDDLQILSVIDKMVKQRRESIAQFEAGGRQDLVARESEELKQLSDYLPAQLSDAELDALISEAIATTAASSIKDMGKVMALIKAKAQGRADMGAVGARIKAKLS